jgi:hypothetical protein
MQHNKTMENLLENELSAVVIYQQVLENFKEQGNTNESEFLMPILNGHIEAVTSLQKHIHEQGAKPSTHSGRSGSWAKVIQGGIKMFRLQTALIVLLDAENSCAADYEQILHNPQLPLSIRCLIEWKLLLNQKSHTRILDQHLDAMPA